MNNLDPRLVRTDAEQSVIGSVLLDNKAYYKVYELNPEDFYTRPHRLIWNAIERFCRNREPLDIVTLSSHLEGSNLLDDVGGLAYITDVVKNTPTALNVRAYAAIVRDTAYRRELKSAHEDLIDGLTDFSSSAEEHAASGISLLTALSNKQASDDAKVRHISELCEDWKEEFEKRMSGESAGGLTTGLRDLDKQLAPKGVVDGALFVVGARPKCGKTQLALKTIDHITGLGHTGLVFSMEMSEIQIVERSLTQVGGVQANCLYPDRDGTLHATDEDLSKTIATLGDFMGRELYVSSKPALNIVDMELRIRERYDLSGGKLKAVWIDYLTLMDVDQSSPRHDLAYAAITRRLKVVAKELNIAIFLLIQLNRGLEQRADKRPMPSDGRETGQIEQDCDYWLGIYRDHLYDESSDPSHCELLLRLNRHGSPGTVHVKFDNGRFDDWNAPVPNKHTGRSGHF